MSNNIRLQNLRDFTVQIRHSTSDEIVGTGIVVSLDGKIVTCAHVVEAAGVDPRSAARAEVGVYFPQVRAEEKRRRALVAAFFPEHDDDVVVLRLLDGPTPLEPAQIAVLGTAQWSANNRFQSYGYRRLEDYNAGLAAGLILGSVEPPRQRVLQADPVQLESSQINQGMSGAAVLDLDRNLVVGIVSETWFPDTSTKDRDTAWAVDARVLSLAPLNLPVRDAPLPLRADPPTRITPDVTPFGSLPVREPRLDDAPIPLPEWVDRSEMLEALRVDWLDEYQRVTSLIGFGGEGKSSLARRWLDDLLSDPTLPQPAGVFWWNFGNRPDVDSFFDAAIDYLVGAAEGVYRLPTSGAKAHLLAALLTTNRYLFILDGLEAAQHQMGDRYGLLKSASLREFLRYCAAGEHKSFCLITSRVPVLDLVEYVTHSHRDVGGLSPADGCALLRQLGAQGSDEVLAQVSAEWDGHALTLSLLGAHLMEQYGGDVSQLGHMPVPTRDVPHYKRVQQILRQYDEHLNAAEQGCLKVLSAIRMPVDKPTLQEIFRPDGENSLEPSIAHLAALDKEALETVLAHLVALRMLRSEGLASQYATHSLIRSYYYDRQEAAERTIIHQRLKNFYLLQAERIRAIRDEIGKAIGADLPPFGWLHIGEHVVPSDPRQALMEAVHHACGAGSYEEAYNIYFYGVQEGAWTLVHQLGAFDTDLWLLREFFPDGDYTQVPLTPSPESQSRLINQVGYCFMQLGWTREALTYFRRCSQLDEQSGDLRNAVFSRSNSVEALTHLGELQQALEEIQSATVLANQAHDVQAQSIVAMLGAWVNHLSGNLAAAEAWFERAFEYQRQLEPDFDFLYGMVGIAHTIHLWRTGEEERACRLAEENAALCEQQNWIHFLTHAYRILGDMRASDGNEAEAQQFYDWALEVARQVPARDPLIRALTAHGKWMAQCGHNWEAAFHDLDEALACAIAAEYRLAEVDTRIALARVHLIAGNSDKAREEVETAQRISIESGYYWGNVDAEEVLAELNKTA